MPGDVICSASEITPEWLTETLRSCRVLTRGDVVGIALEEPETTFASDLYRLAVTYSAGASRGAPRRLFLKISTPSLQPGPLPREQWRREYDFYTGIAPAMDAQITIPAFSAAYDEETGASHLLLLDVSDTHRPCLAPEEAPAEGGPLAAELAVDALAALHAAWWGYGPEMAVRLGIDVGPLPGPEDILNNVKNARHATAAFIGAAEDGLPLAWREVYGRVLDAMPSLYTRHARRPAGRASNLTLVHGDAHLGNFLFPRDAAGSAYLLDWQFWHPTIGGTDLAFLIATRWPPETRRRLEKPLLQRYHRGLVSRDVTGYSFDACWDDYRLSVILVSLFIPIWQCSLWGWSPNLDNAAASIAAYEELGCEELLGREW